eukprot:3491943-Prymnesium_polylepis.1
MAGLAIGLALIGMGGAGVQLSVQSVSALFPKNKSLVMASLSGAFQAASGVYLVFDVISDNTGASRLALLLAHAGIALVVAVASVLAWPNEVFGPKKQTESASKPAAAAPVTAPDVPATPTTPSNSAAATEAPAAAAAPAVPASHWAAEPLPLKQRPFRGQVLTAEFALMVCFFTVNALQCQFTVQSIGVQLEAKGDSDGAVTRLFSLALALSFLATPFIGTMFDRIGFTRVFAVVNTLLIGVPVTLLFDSLRAQYLTCIFYSVGRVGQWASFFAFMGATFGFSNYGKLVGGGLMFQACVSLLQYPLLAITVGPLQRDFTFVNVLFVVLSACQYPVILALCRRLGEGSLRSTHHKAAALPLQSAEPAPVQGSTEPQEIAVDIVSGAGDGSESRTFPSPTVSAV